MPRVARIVLPGAAHHVVQRGNNKQDVFFVDDDHREYFSRRGYHILETTDGAVPWGNNIGGGWFHNYNMRIQESETTNGYGAPVGVQFVTAMGNAMDYEWSARVSAWGIDVYVPVGTRAFTHELSNGIWRNYTTGNSVVFAEDNLRHHFSAVSAADLVGRLTSISDATGTTLLSFDYDGAVGTGRLTKVNFPSGDPRHMAFSYVGNLITKAAIMKNTTTLADVEYAYSDDDELTTVTDAGGATEHFEYGSWYDTENDIYWGRCPTSYTDKNRAPGTTGRDGSS